MRLPKVKFRTIIPPRGWRRWRTWSRKNKGFDCAACILFLDRRCAHTGVGSLSLQLFLND